MGRAMQRLVGRLTRGTVRSFPPLARQLGGLRRISAVDASQQLKSRLAFLCTGTAGAAVAGVVYMGEAMADAEDEEGVVELAKGYVNGFFAKFTEPSREVLLPSLPPHMAHLPTLVL